MFDLQVVELKQRLIKEINESSIPLSVLNYILQDVHTMVKQALEEQLKIDREQKSLISVEPGCIESEGNDL